MRWGSLRSDHQALRRVVVWTARPGAGSKGMREMDERERLLLAYAIAEWDTAVKHLWSMTKHTTVPYAVLGRVQKERLDLCHRWAAAEGVMCLAGIESVIRRVREYLTERQTELSELLHETEVNT